MTITATTTTITIDESAGLQNTTATPSPTFPAGDANDNDIAISALQTTFADRLTALGITGLKEAALSGYDGSAGNSGANVVSVTPNSGTISSLGFFGPDGGDDDTNPDPLKVYSGDVTQGVNSGLTTVSGFNIYLFADATGSGGLGNNLVLGYYHDTGTSSDKVAFAVYLDQTTDALGNITGAKMWTVITGPLAHTLDGSTPAAYDNSLDLTNKLFVAAEQNLTFDASDAPSGNNLFIMFAGSDTTKAIVATGMQPANQSTGANVSSGDTIVTSQVTDTTFGTNAQQIKPPSKTDPNGNGIWFTFVTNPEQNYTVPNLSPTEANLEANIQYNTFFSANEASFDVVQLQGGKSAVVKITAVNSPHDGATGEDGTNYVDGVLHDFNSLSDTSVTITSVVLTGANTGTFTRVAGDEAGVTWNDDGSVTLSGILAGTNIDYTTDGPHERVLIQNAGSGTGNASAAFDIGGFQITTVTSSATEVGSHIKFEDDGPDVAVVDIVNGNLGEDPQNGTWTHAPGADGFKSLNITLNSYKIDDNTTVDIPDRDLGTKTTADAYTGTTSSPGRSRTTSTATAPQRR